MNREPEPTDAETGLSEAVEPENLESENLGSENLESENLGSENLEPEDVEPAVPQPSPAAPAEDVPAPPATARKSTGKVKRVETAVAPIIQAETVAIPTPAWGVAVPDPTETIEAELVETGETPELEGGLEDMPGSEWGPVQRQWPGWLALLVAVATAVLTGVAVSVDARHASEPATVLAWVAIGCSIAAFLGGVLAAVFNRGRLAGVAAALLGLFANPWILLQVLTLLKG